LGKLKLLQVKKEKFAKYMCSNIDDNQPRKSVSWAKTSAKGR